MVSPLLTRGLGPAPAIVTAGLGAAVEVDDVAVDLDLVRGRRPKDRPRSFIESAEIFKIAARLVSVNGKAPVHSIAGSQKGLIDYSIEHDVKSTGKMRIVKTRRTNNIIINVTEAYRKK